MTTAPLACPYCNAAVTVAPGTPAGRRVSCPRCGDGFVLRQPVAADNGIQHIPPLAAPPLNRNALRRPRQSNRRVAALVLGVMGFMAAATLAYALLTVPDRRGHDSGIAHKSRRAPQQVEGEAGPTGVAPDKLGALSYLPADTGLVVGVHVAELLATPSGRKLLQSSFKIGEEDVRADVLLGWAGLRLDDVDHLVLGVKLDDSLLPRLQLIARVKEPLDPERLRQRLDGHRLAGGKKGAFLFSPPGRPLPLALFCPDDRTVVLALVAAHLDVIPDKPDADLGQLPGDVREVLREHREAGSLLWVVGHAEDWGKTPARLLLDKMKKENREALEQVRTFGLWVQMDGAVIVKGSFHCANPDGARALEEFFRAPRRKPNATLKTAVEEAWLRVQFRSDLAALTEGLSR